MKPSKFPIYFAHDVGSVKTNALLNVISHQSDIYENFLYAKNPFETKYVLLIRKQKDVALKDLDDSKGFTEYSNDNDDIYESIKECTIYRERKN